MLVITGAKFEFPTLTNPNSYTAERGVQIALPFELDTHNCTDLPETSTITVSKRTGDLFVEVCKLLAKRDGTCFSFRPEECVCWEEKGRYALSKIMDKSDITLWSWTIGNDGQIAAERNISLDMLPCAKFEFPTMTNPNSYTAERGVQIALPFQLDTHNCTDLPETSTITVSKRTEDHFVDVCKLLAKRDGTCFSLRPEECVCWEEKGRYALSKIMDKSDITLWSWTIGNDGQIAAERKISVDMLPYPPSVEQLTFNSISDQASFSHPLEPSMSVDINCTYDKGYPETSAGLLKDSQGFRLAASRDDGNEQAGTVRHTLTDISCDDMVDISCEVSGASKNLTKALLVKCPPKLPKKDLQLVSHFGLHNELPIPLSSDTKQLRSCKVAKVIQGHHQNQGLDEVYEPEVKGTLPEGTLELRVDKVTPDHIGTWRLTVSNEEGSDDLTFILKVTAGERSAASVNGGGNAGYIAGVVVAVIIITSLSSLPRWY
ncbi:hypothetical protein V1264_017258 [Littorina saxatilis]|uniref:Uncharacterized protein n=1 Tax=Littorina saxatilis TaxID=31220 RepID=A0AAN9BIA8_9CAEN